MSWAIVIKPSQTLLRFNALFKINLRDEELQKIKEILGKELPDGFVIDVNTQLVYVVINGEVKPFPLTHIENLKFLKALTQVVK